MSKFSDIAPRVFAGLATDEELAAYKVEDVVAMKSDPDHVHYRFSSSLKAIDKQKRTASYIASTESVDRSGDIILVKGWKLEAFARNPQFLMEHTPSLGPLGLATEMRKGTYNGVRSLLADVAVHDDDKLGDEARLRARLVLDGDVVGMSVGYIPLDTVRPQSDDERKTLGLGRYGVLYKSQELFEVSSVLIPDNGDALQKRLMALVESGEVAESLARDMVREWTPSSRVVVKAAKIVDEDPEPEPLPAWAVELKSTLSAELAALRESFESKSTAPSPAPPTGDQTIEAKTVDVTRANDPQAFYGAALAVPFLRYTKGRKQ